GRRSSGSPRGPARPSRSETRTPDRRARGARLPSRVVQAFTLRAMAEALSVAVTRGEIVESTHRVHAVAVQDGKVVAAAGDPDLMVSLRSSAKPIQALLLARARKDLEEEH